MKNIVVLISGNGSNLQAIIDAIESNQIAGRISLVVSNRSDAFGLQRAAKHNIPSLYLDHKHFDNREQYDAELLKVIRKHNADLVVLAGFMRILTAHFVSQLYGKILNIHPSLLPKYKGLHTHQRALENRDDKHGPTVHFVTPELDGGPVILQSPIDVKDTDSADSLAQRVQIEERKIYPLVVSWFCNNRLVMQDNSAYLDNYCLGDKGYINETHH